MIIAVANEHRDGETRVALTPTVVKRLIAMGVEVHIEQGAGGGAFIGDDGFADAGAKVIPAGEAGA